MGPPRAFLYLWMEMSIMNRAGLSERPSEPMNPLRRRCSFLFLLGCLSACGGGTSATGDKEANEMFQSLCKTCHGDNGHGDGPGAAALNPKPRSFADATWQNSVTDEQIKKTIVYGGAAVGKSANMPAQPQLKGKDDVLTGLVHIVRSWRPK